MKNYKQPKITIALATCFSQETFLRRAINVIISQTFTDWELVIVNDGADKKVKEIVFSYKNQVDVDYGENKNAKIRYFETDINVGISKVRNIGMNYAQGEYILFHDDDDYLYSKNGTKYALEEMIKEIGNEEIDIFMYSHIHHRYYKSVAPFSCINLKYGLTPENINDFKKPHKYLLNFETWNQLFNKKFLIDNNLFFNTDLRIYEDIEHRLRFIFLTKKIKFSQNPYYFYFANPNSLVANFNRNFCDCFFVVEIFIETLKKYNVYNELRIYIIKFTCAIVQRIIGDFEQNKLKLSDKLYVRKYFNLFDIKDDELKYFEPWEQSIIYWIS